MQTATIMIVILLLILGIFIFLIIKLLLALLGYIKSKKGREETPILQKPLGETLKEQRIRCKMTQEFVADALGVSRQAVSKCENGSSAPSTGNLLALAKLYDIPAEELLKGIKSNTPPQATR